jgi:histidinol dehydrogenase
MNILREPLRKDWTAICKRPEIVAQDLNTLTDEIFNAIKDNGDAALLKYIRQYDGADLETVLVPETEIRLSENNLPAKLKTAIDKAAANIEKFHKAQIVIPIKVETTDGVVCWQESRAIEKIGIYIPGGTAPLFSTVLMLAIPATIAGCGEIVLCTPPDRNGNINPAILYAAKITGVTKVIAAGGIQAIAALTFGTASVPKVYKIFGPGNQYVAAAKQKAFGYGIATDLPAGPSELLVVADETSIPAYVAADLLSQAEHGTDSQVVCISNNEATLRAVIEQLEIQMETLPRKEIIAAALANSKLILLKDKQAIIDFVNEYAPEHLILCTNDNTFYTSRIRNAGSVFIGNDTPESAGDYASGTNHTLPTNGFAKAYSGVNLDAFVKKITFQEITKQGLEKLSSTIECMAAAEGLQAHKNAVSVRMVD